MHVNRVEGKPGDALAAQDDVVWRDAAAEGVGVDAFVVGHAVVGIGHEAVVAGAAEQGIRALAAGQRVVAGIAVHDVVAATAIENIGAVIGKDHVVAVETADAIRHRRADQRRRGTEPVVVAAGAVDVEAARQNLLVAEAAAIGEANLGERRVLARRRRQEVQEVHAVGVAIGITGTQLDQQAAAAEADGAGREAGAEHQHATVAALARGGVVDEVFAVATLEQVAVAAGTAEQHIGAGATRDHVVAGIAEDGVAAGAAIEIVGSGVAGQHALGAIAGEHVVAVAAEQHVLTATAEQHVVAGATIEKIVAGLAEQPVVTGAAEHAVAAGGRHIAQLGAFEPRFEEQHAIDVVREAPQRPVAAGGGEAGVAPHHVVTRPTEQQVVAAAAQHRIGIRAAHDLVAARTRRQEITAQPSGAGRECNIERLGARVSIDLIVAIAAVDHILIAEHGGDARSTAFHPVVAATGVDEVAAVTAADPVAIVVRPLVAVDLLVQRVGQQQEPADRIGDDQVVAAQALDTLAGIGRDQGLGGSLGNRLDAEQAEQQVVGGAAGLAGGERPAEAVEPDLRARRARVEVGRLAVTANELADRGRTARLLEIDAEVAIAEVLDEDRRLGDVVHLHP